MREEITGAAMELFLAQGYDATTTSDIARAAGMSQRSLFRYFATKEDIVIGKLDLRVGSLDRPLGARPAGEDPWTSVREVVLAMHADSLSERDAALLRMVFQTPALMSVYLQRLLLLQESVAALLRTRAREAGHPYRADDPTPEVVANVTFGCLVAAQQTVIASNRPHEIPNILERALNAVQSSSCDRGALGG